MFLSHTDVSISVSLPVHQRIRLSLTGKALLFMLSSDHYGVGGEGHRAGLSRFAPSQLHPRATLFS